MEMAALSSSRLEAVVPWARAERGARERDREIKRDCWLLGSLARGEERKGGDRFSCVMRRENESRGGAVCWRLRREKGKEKID